MTLQDSLVDSGFLVQVYNLVVEVSLGASSLTLLPSIFF